MNPGMMERRLHQLVCVLGSLSDRGPERSIRGRFRMFCVLRGRIGGGGGGTILFTFTPARIDVSDRSGYSDNLCVHFSYYMSG